MNIPNKLLPIEYMYVIIILIIVFGQVILMPNDIFG